MYRWCISMSMGEAEDFDGKMTKEKKWNGCHSVHFSWVL